jgi:hypothetical protein
MEEKWSKGKNQNPTAGGLALFSEYVYLVLEPSRLVQRELEWAGGEREAS